MAELPDDHVMSNYQNDEITDEVEMPPMVDTAFLLRLKQLGDRGLMAAMQILQVNGEG